MSMMLRSCSCCWFERISWTTCAFRRWHSAEFGGEGGREGRGGEEGEEGGGGREEDGGGKGGRDKFYIYA